MGGGIPHPPRAMGVADLALFYVVTGVSLRWIATAAAAGPSAILIWAGGFLCFYLPLALTVVELSSRYPKEGGLYVWTRRAFGPTAGFMAGWSYFTSNLPYFPSVFYFDAANALYIGGHRWQWLHDSPAFFVTFSLVAMTAITALNIVGLRLGKWLHNIGALGMWLPALIVIGLGALAYARHGSATSFAPVAIRPHVDLDHMLFWSSLFFAYSGCETASFMAGEVRDARRTIPRALLISGAIITFCYVVGTIAVLLALRPEEVNPLQGLIQAGALTAERLGVAWLVAPLALLITIGNLGAASGFLAACSRIPFAVGIDRMLPAAFGRMSPRFGTPVNAIVLQGALGAAFVVLGQAGASVKGAYDVLVSLGIIAAFIPFAMMFLALIRLRGEAGGGTVSTLRGGRALSIALACVGFLTTCGAILLAALPAADETNPPLAIAKVVGGTAVLLVTGWLVQAAGTRAARRAAAKEPHPI